MSEDIQREAETRQEFLATMLAHVGSDVFNATDPGATIRQASTGAIIHANLPTVRSSTLESKLEPREPARVVPGTTTLSRFTEFTVQALVGKGGMGQVYVAGQNALRREVAIKRINPEHLVKDTAKEAEQAFICEALAMGFLDHPNIVPVYSLGRDQEGKWFFSMKMVRGTEWRQLLHPEHCKDADAKRKALAAHLDITDPARRVEHIEENLQILNAVCNAIAFSHSKKIIHRDLKPENVMVGAFGEVLVMDWGLAVDVSEDPPPIDSPERRVPTRKECGLGGTPAYMAPEQCAFNDQGHYVSDNLNTWTDVFQLGAILYELLSGGPPFMGDSLRDVCGKVAKCVPPALPETAPAELAAICKKALSREPKDRYPDALAFQHALQGFLKHHQAAIVAAKAEREAKVQQIPNLARGVVLYDEALELWPDNAEYRVRREAMNAILTLKERNVRATKTAAIALAALVFIGITIAFFGVHAARKEENRLRVEAEKQKKIVELRSLELKDTLRVSGERGDLLTKTLDNQFADIQELFHTLPGQQTIKRHLLRNTLDGFKKAAEVMPDSIDAKRQVAMAFLKLGEISVEIGETQDAAECFQGALDGTRELAEADKTSAQAQRDLALSYLKMGEVLARKGNSEGAMDAFQKCYAIRQKQTQAEPKNPDAMRDLANVLMNIGSQKAKIGDAAAGMEAYKRSLAIREALVDMQPGNKVAQRDLSEMCRRIGFLALQMGQIGEAQVVLDRSVMLCKAVVAADPKDMEAQRDLSGAYIGRGRVFVQSGDVAAGLVEYQNSLEVLKKVVEQDTLSVLAQRYLSFSYTSIGDVNMQMGNAAAAFDAHESALEIRQKLSIQDPGSKEALRDLSMSYIGIGDANIMMGTAEGALASYKMAFDIRVALAAENKKSGQAQSDLAEAHVKLGDATIMNGDAKAGLESYKLALAIREKRAEVDAKSATVRRDLSVACEKMGDAYMVIGDNKAANENYIRSRDIRKELAAMDNQNATAHRDLAQAYEKMGDIEIRLEKQDKALIAYQKSLEIRAELAKSDSKNAEMQSDLAQSHEKLGDLHMLQSNTEAAIQDYQRGLEILKKLAEDDANNVPEQVALKRAQELLERARKMKK